MDQKPFLDLFPYYKQELTINLILEFTTLLILSLLIIQFIRRKHRTFELTLFFQMCLCDVFMVIFAMALDIYPVFLTFDDYIPDSTLIMIFIVPPIVDRIFTIALLVQWLVYVEYALHQSRELINRRCAAAFWVFAAAALAQLISIFTFFLTDDPEKVQLVYNIISIISGIILISFIIATYVKFYREKKRNRIPTYIRLTPTTLCVIAGFSVKLFLSATYIAEFEILPLSFAVGLLLADYYMYKRLRNIDPDTGFYNRRYLSTLIDHTKKNELKNATVISFKTSHIDENTAALLKSWERGVCKTIKTGDDQYLLISEPVNDIDSDHFISLVTDHFENENIPMKTIYNPNRDARLDELLKKYL